MRLADQIRTTAFLFTWRYMVLLFLSLTIVLGFINWTTIAYLEQETEDAIRADMRSLAALSRQADAQALAQLIAAKVRANPEGDELYLLADRELNPLVGNLDSWPELQAGEDGWVFFNHAKPGSEAVPARARLAAPTTGLWLLVGRRQPGLEQLGGLFNRTLFWGLAITLALALAGGYYMSADVLSRVNTINATSRKIMSGDLSQRIRTRGTGDEFDELARNLNAMLDQIESLMVSIQHISDNVAHDLRTPLTRLRNRLEDLQRNASAEQLTEIEACQADADGLLSTFASLLSIARIESGTSGAPADPVDISRVTADACELYQAVAEEKSIRLEWSVAAHCEVLGDRNLVFQALTNLLDNAIKYTPQSGQIDVRLDSSDDHIRLSVADNGPGIPADQRDRVLQRFYRLDKSRSEPGAGLGLSLVQAVAARHRATLTLEDNAPGLRVRLEFPRPGADGPGIRAA